ncbi:hypothetical protein BDN72DRAFT_732574, partial [Pluteus cervinus]
SGSISGIDLKRELTGQYSRDSFYSKILEAPKQYKNFVVKDNLVFIVENGGERLCIPDVQIGKRSAREILIDEAHSILAHLSTRKTLTYLREYVWWK